MKKNVLSMLLDKMHRQYALNMERRLYLNWFNPLVTIYFNLRLLPFKDAVRLPIFVYGWPRVLSLYGKAEVGGGKIGRIKLNRNFHEAGAPANMGGPEEFNIWGTIVFKGKCQIGTGGKITVGDCGKLILGDDSKIMSQCNITAYKFVTIGNSFLMAHRSQIFDTGYHYVADFNNHRVKQIAAPIHIGSNCWICNSSSIMGGVSIPNHTIIASHSLVNKDMAGIPEESIVGGSPAKLIGTGYRKINKPEMLRKVSRYFSVNPYEIEFKFEENINHKLF